MKTNIRSIRLSDEILALIEQQDGTTFTEKFEGLVSRAYLSVPEAESKLEQLEEKIAAAKQRLQQIDRAVYRLNSTILTINALLEHKLNELSNI